MRPVNLIPPEDRRGDRAPLRAGALSYVLVGAAAAALVAVLAVVLTQNSITERENEVAELEVRRDAAQQKATALAPYAQFAALQEQRELTVSSLAQSRFDWERVLRELALVVPDGVTLEGLDASTAGGTEAGETDVATDTPGVPSLAMSGCAPDHDVVAELVAALEDIDGITRVGLENSTKSGAGDAAAEGTTSGSTADGASCGTGATMFALTAVFDGVSAEAIAPAPEPTPAPPPAAGSETNSQAEQGAEAEQATNIVPGTAR